MSPEIKRRYFFHSRSISVAMKKASFRKISLSFQSVLVGVACRFHLSSREKSKRRLPVRKLNFFHKLGEESGKYFGRGIRPALCKQSLQHRESEIYHSRAHTHTHARGVFRLLFIHPRHAPRFTNAVHVRVFELSFSRVV